MCFGNLTSPTFFYFQEPQYRGCVKMEPYWRFSLCRSKFLSNLRAIPVMRPIMVLLVFPLFCRHFGCLWVPPNQTRRVLFDTHDGPFYTPKTLRFKGKCPILTRKILQNLGKNKRTNGSILTHALPNILIFSSVFVLREPTQPKKSPGLPCASFEPELCNKLIRICGPPTPQNTQQMLVCN